MRVRLNTGRGDSYQYSVESEHWSQVRRKGENTSYEVLALAVCEDAYMLALQWERQTQVVQRELSAWFGLRAVDCARSDPRRAFCLDTICNHFGWDLFLVRESYREATTLPARKGTNMVRR